MRNTSISQYQGRFPQKETAFAFIAPDKLPFSRAVIGITYPCADYHIKRPSSATTNVFEYVLEGEGEILLNGTWHTAKSGDIYILCQGELHEYRSNPQNPWKKIWINYVADYMPSFLHAYNITSGIYTSENAPAYFDQALSYSKDGISYPHINYDIAQCVHNIIYAVASERERGDSDEYRIRESLNAAIYEKLNMDELAERLHMSKSNVIRVFKKRYGVTPYDYLLSIKIETAKVLLRDTKMTIKEIANKLQISDEHYFSSLFLARVGMRPRDYRLAQSTTH